MSASPKSYIKQWLEKANEDVIVAQTLLENKPVLVRDAICYHCQQAVEKFFKACLIYHDIEIDKTHNLEILQEKLLQIDKVFMKIELENLTSFSVNARYPDSMPSPSIKEVKYYFDVVNQVKKLVESKLNLK